MEAYSADRSLKGKLRRRLAKLRARRPAAAAPGRPMISFSFDDAPATAAEAGAAALQERGLRGTYFICAGTLGQDGPMGVNLGPDAVGRLAADGHEIACHTFSHLDCSRAGAQEIEADAARNAEALGTLGLPRPAAFAYPFGEISVRAKRALAPRFGLLRALHHGVIGQGSDLNQAPGVGIEGPGGEAVASRWIDEAARRGGWLILYTHDVRPDPSPWGCTPQALGRLADKALAEGFEVVTVAEGCRRIGASASSV
jgi:peptidoglycan/xylan/chitin deacetylase (PgdA/CDA1 family)